jgi:hypothetical protein
VKVDVEVVGSIGAIPGDWIRFNGSV